MKIFLSLSTPVQNVSSCNTPDNFSQYTNKEQLSILEFLVLAGNSFTETCLRSEVKIEDVRRLIENDGLFFSEGH